VHHHHQQQQDQNSDSRNKSGNRVRADSGVSGSKKNYKNNSNTVSDKLIGTTLILIVKTQMWRVWGRGEGCTGFWWGSLKEGDHWGDPDVDGRIILRWIFRKWEGMVGTGWSSG
jgi:hypothetical protein